ncbi:MAG: hypothetical protein WA885_14470 [Phormidesmis sp.]
MFSYFVYGLALQSNRLIPSLPFAQSTSAADVKIDFKEIVCQPPPSAFEETAFGVRTRRDGDALAYDLWFQGSKGRVEFEINNLGSHISITLMQATLDAAAALLSGRILGLTLRLRGILCLHACVINIGGSAVAIVGESGAGKSTTGAALAKRGHAILSDDIAALKQQSDHWLVQPGYPRLRLWPNSVCELYQTGVKPKKIFDSCDKVFVDLSEEKDISKSNSCEAVGQFQTTPLPLKAIYILQKRRPGSAAPAIEPVALPSSAMHLMAHRSAGSITLDSKRQSKEFAAIAQMVQTVPVRQVTRSDRLDYLPQLCDAIENDAARLLAPEECLTC